MTRIPPLIEHSIAIQRLKDHWWANCQTDGRRKPCWHHPYWDLNDWHSTEEAIERTDGHEERLIACATGEGPDWAGFADEYDDSRLDLEERESRARTARERQGFA